MSKTELNKKQIKGWPSSFVGGNIPAFDADGNLEDSGVSPADIAGKAAIIYGYLFEGVFYEESTHTTAITPTSANQYVDMTDATAPVPYIWNGSAYIATGGGDIPDEVMSLIYAGL